jgi:galactokinase
VPRELRRTPPAAPMAVREVRAFAPGRVNLIGEHTDYNGGLALPFAIAEGVTVRGCAAVAPRIVARALDLDEEDEFALVAGDSSRPTAATPPAGWRAFVRGAVAELGAAGVLLPGAQLEIQGEIPRGAGLSSSAALTVALALALLALADAKLDRRALARLCSRVENEWVGARTGLLDQLASLFGAADTALLIDFATLELSPVPLLLVDGWRLATVDSGDRRELAGSLYNERRAECARACRLLGVASLREARPEDLARLPEPLGRRARHVLEENTRVQETVGALRDGDLAQVGDLLNASHASLRDNYDSSTSAVERTVRQLREGGAAGARMMGGGFGGSVLALLAPATPLPQGAHQVRPSRGALLI